MFYRQSLGKLQQELKPLLDFQEVTFLFCLHHVEGIQQLNGKSQNQLVLCERAMLTQQKFIELLVTQ